MNRLLTVLSCELRYSVLRPFFWIWYAVMAWNAWLLSTGNWLIRSVDTAVGTQKSFVNSEFQIAFAFALMTVLIFGFFMAIAAGTSLMRDEQYKVGEILHSTPLRPVEYVWGKFLAIIISSLGVLILFLLTLMLLNEVIPNPATTEIHGPFRIRNYLMPTVCFVLPALVFVAGCCFAIGEFTRRAFLVYLFPVILLLGGMNFLYAWYPPDATPAMTRFMQSIDPGGFRWLKQTWLIVDRGVSFYNNSSIQYDAPFLASRIAFIVVGLALVSLSAGNFRRKRVRVADAAKQKPQVVIPATPVPAVSSGFLPQMKQQAPSSLHHLWNVARFELKELASQPWIYLFIAVIAIILVMPDRTSFGEFRVQLLYTSGLVAVSRMIGLTIMICFFLLFTNTESLYREQQTGLSSFFFSTPVPTWALLLGKAIANFSLALAALVTSAVTVILLVLLKAEAPLEFGPFLYVWGCLMFPTFVFWTTFVLASYSLTGSRLATYGIALGLLVITGWLTANDKINWVTNWPLANSVVWSDLGVFELDRLALVLNRLMVLSLSVSLIAFAIRFFPRRMGDRHRSMRKTGGLTGILRAIALIAVPLALGIILWIQIENGFEGRAAREARKNYWRHNVATFWNYPLPDRTFIDMDIRFEPETRAFQVKGSYEMINSQSHPLYRIPLTLMAKTDHLQWTVNGKPVSPETRSGLYVVQPSSPVKPQDKLTVGFSYTAAMLPGVSRNGGELELGEFILPSGIVLTGRNPFFIPVLGFVETIGVDEKNRYEQKVPDPFFYEGITESDIDRSQLNTRIRIDVPEEYLVTSMGVLTEETVSSGRRINVWESDYPLRVFNVVAGKWAVKKGKTATIYYHPGHAMNVDSMLETLEGARKYYSEWFGEYPWKELRMSEFPGLSFYARGNPTNIFFSEGMGFLTKDSMEEIGKFGVSAMYVTAHEAAHQWWGHILAPGKGPGGIILAEGMANFASMCLMEEMKGPQMRQNYCRQIERVYGEDRFVTSERPLAETTGSRPADTTVIYDKGGWVFWMLRELIGKEQMYAGLKSFAATWHRGPDHPVIQDFVAHLRNYAPDQVAYDEFAQQWFFRVATPEFRYMTRPEKRKMGIGWEVKTKIKNVGTAKMAVEIAASRGTRFEKDFEESRTILTLSPEEEKDMTLACGFEPERIEVDPDVRVLQLQRNGASYRLR